MTASKQAQGLKSFPPEGGGFYQKGDYKKKILTCYSVYLYCKINELHDIKNIFPAVQKVLDKHMSLKNKLFSACLCWKTQDSSAESLGFDQIVETPGRRIAARRHRRSQQRPRLGDRVGRFGDDQLNQVQTRRSHRSVGKVLQIHPLYPGEVQQRPIGRGRFQSPPPGWEK